jgi:hypothetical protein
MNKFQIFLIILVATCILLFYLNSDSNNVYTLKFNISKASSTNSLKPLNNEKFEEHKQKILAIYKSITDNEFKVFSQNKEDGVLNQIMKMLNMRYKGYYVEFGTENGNEINTRYLREKFEWTGLLMDGSNENPAINLHRESIMHSNILDLFEKYKVPIELNLFSEDTDYGDYWIVEKVLQKYRPKVVIHEVNQQTSCVVVPKPDKLTFWDGSNFHGGSVCSFYCLAKRFDYTMIYCESAGVNCFWIRNDLIEKYLQVDPKIVQQVLVPSFLYKKPVFVYRSTNNKWEYVNCTNSN